MKHRTLLFALITSLAFNIGFLIIFGYFTYNRPEPFMPPPPRTNTRMHQVFKNEDMQALRKENIEHRKELFAELAKSEFNKETIEDILQRLEASQKEIEHNVLQNFIKIRQESTPEEAQEIFGAFLRRYEGNRERSNNRRNNEPPKRRVKCANC